MPAQPHTLRRRDGESPAPLEVALRRPRLRCPGGEVASRQVRAVSGLL